MIDIGVTRYPLRCIRIAVLENEPCDHLMQLPLGNMRHFVERLELLDRSLPKADNLGKRNFCFDESVEQRNRIERLHGRRVSVLCKSERYTAMRISNGLLEMVDQADGALAHIWVRSSTPEYSRAA